MTHSGMTALGNTAWPCHQAARQLRTTPGTRNPPGRVGRSGLRHQHPDLEGATDGLCQRIRVFRRGNIVDMRRLAIAVSTVLPLILLAGCGGGSHAARRSSPTSFSPTTSAPSLPTVWTNRTPPPGIVGPLNDVTCPTQLRCYAVGGSQDDSGTGSIIASADGGATWQLQYTASQTFLDGITCTSAATCIAVGGLSTAAEAAKVVMTDNGGQHWTSVALPIQVGNLEGVACATSTVCVAIGLVSGVAVGTTTVAGGYTIVRTTDGGTTWGTVTTPAGLAAINTVTCPTSSFCIVGGSGPGPSASSPALSSASLDGGETWESPIVAGGTSGLDNITCIDAQKCIGLIGSGGTDTWGEGLPTITTNGGQTWSEGTLSIGQAVSCTKDMCLSAGATHQEATNVFLGDAFISTNDGQSWTPVSPPQSQGLSRRVWRNPWRNSPMAAP